MRPDENQQDVKIDDEGQNGYLWDRSEPADPFVESLERDLAGARLKQQTLDDSGASVRTTPLISRRLGLLSAAAIVLIGATLWINFNQSGTGWIVAELEGSPLIDSLALGADARVGKGKWITTDANSRATFRNRELGSVTLDPNGRMRVTNATSREQRLELRKGRINASIYAPPRLFIVDTPSAKAVDMGCSYTLDVDESGQGLLAVSIGRVDLSGSAGDVRVTAGAACRIRPGVGPGTPYFEDADPTFIDAVARFDAADEAGRAAIAVEILAAARERDSITVWHVALSLSGQDRTRAIVRLYELVPELGSSPPSGTMSDRAILRLWEGLGLAW